MSKTTDMRRMFPRLKGTRLKVWTDGRRPEFEGVLDEMTLPTLFFTDVVVIATGEMKAEESIRIQLITKFQIVP